MSNDLGKRPESTPAPDAFAALSAVVVDARIEEVRTEPAPISVRVASSKGRPDVRRTSRTA
ncbi:hypothetical protein [Streptomyces sp. CB01201]|uniref:hypothetical protein n=1 Tax=Streptomyces sp. CB01201 TaxID=2020324 RepID=UPI00131C1D30|nr:hypothetical protein [Streptomyces sp. CB01201]